MSHTAQEAFLRALHRMHSDNRPSRTKQGTSALLYTIAVVLLILWLVGLVTSYTIGGFVHVLLVIAVILVPLRVIGRRGTA